MTICHFTQGLFLGVFDLRDEFELVARYGHKCDAGNRDRRWLREPIPCRHTWSHPSTLLCETWNLHKQTPCELE